MDLEDTARNADAAAAPNYGGGLLTRSGSNGVDVVGGRDGNTLVVLRHDSPSDTAKLVPTSDNQPNHGPKSFPCAETLSEIHFGGEAEAKAVLDSGVHCPATNGNPELGGGGDRAAERYSDSKSIGPEVSKGLDVQISKAESVADVGSKDKTGLPQQQIEPHTPQELSEPNAIKPGAATSLAEGARPVQPVDLVVSAQSPMGNHDKSSAIAAQPPSGNGGSARLLTPGKSEPEVHLSAEVLHEPSDTSGMHSLDTDVRCAWFIKPWLRESNHAVLLLSASHEQQMRIMFAVLYLCR